MKGLQGKPEHSSGVGLQEAPRPIVELDTPALLVDRQRLIRNLEGMQALAAAQGVSLRPHVKSHKCPVLAAIQRGLGATGLCVAKVSEARVLAEHEPADILVAYPVVGTKARVLADLAVRFPGSRFSALADSSIGLRDLSRAATARGITLGVWLKVDVGLERCGLPPDDPGWSDLARRARTEPNLRLVGLLTHAGQVYGAAPDEVAGIGRAEAERTVELARRLERDGYGPLRVSVGSTPTASHAVAVPGVHEIRPGVYVWGDRQQVSLGAMDPDEVALTVLATVVSHPRPGRWIVDSGSKTLSSDRGAHGTELVSGYGVVRRLEDHRLPDPRRRPFVHPAPESAVPGIGVLSRLSEEHGILESDTITDLTVGDTVEIIPNHACAVVNLHETLHVVSGEREHRQVDEMWGVDARGRVQ